MNFEELKAWVDKLPDQITGRPYAVSDAGEPYIEVFATGIARPGDEQFVECNVVLQIELQITKYFEERQGRIFWRVPLEIMSEPTSLVIKYDDDGPDIDTMLDKRCHMDKNWVRIGIYCRLYRASHSIPADLQAKAA